MSPSFGRRRSDSDEPIHDPERPPLTQPVRVFEVLARHEVEYLTIGGVAVQLYGHERSTLDVDILVDRSPANLERLAGALSDLRAELRGVDAHLAGVDPADPAQLAEGANFTLNTDAGPLDVWTDAEDLPGADRYERMRARGEVARTATAEVRLAGRDDLISLKRAAAKLPNRPDEKAAVDRKDIDVLTARREDIERTVRQLRERKPPGGPVE